MKRPATILAATFFVALAGAAHAQQSPAPGAAKSPPAAPAAAGNPPPAAPSATTKRAACESASANAKGQDRRDQMQLCLAQARIDCLRQAVDQKIIGSERRDFVRSCVGGDDDRGFREKK
jgi:hypothetical protein